MDKLKMRIQEKSHEMDIDQPSVSAWGNIKNKLTNAESDPLKKYIAENSAELEVETPNLHTWERIGHSIAKKPKTITLIRTRLIYLSAACIIVIIGLGIIRGIKSIPVEQEEVFVVKPLNKEVHKIDSPKRETQSEFVTAASVPEPVPVQIIKKENRAIATRSVKKQIQQSLPPEVLQIQKDYEELIAGQINYTKHLAVYGESVDYFERFMNDFKLLDKQEKELRLLIIQNGLQENSIDDLGMIYQQKLTVLKKLQNEINKTSSRNKNLNDTIPAYINL